MGISLLEGMVEPEFGEGLRGSSWNVLQVMAELGFME
jgi:hypothetical protein